MTNIDAVPPHRLSAGFQHNRWLTEPISTNLGSALFDALATAIPIALLESNTSF